ncbi:hypothetical protein R1flu_028576 [Riccia fluitans]|uniref:Uncharacterized protein n=1 Tax=Riccia fluitans TaxID=41844 RepID=A0ABD1XR51_9MARC
MPPSSSSHCSSTQALNDENPITGNTDHYGTVEPDLLPVANNISIPQKANGCPKSSQLRVIPKDNHMQGMLPKWESLKIDQGTAYHLLGLKLVLLI